MVPTHIQNTPDELFSRQPLSPTGSLSFSPTIIKNFSLLVDVLQKKKTRRGESTIPIRLLHEPTVFKTAPVYHTGYPSLMEDSLLLPYWNACKPDTHYCDAFNFNLGISRSVSTRS